MKKKIFSLFLFLITYNLNFSQAYKQIDSLQTLLKKDKADTAKISHLNALSDLYETIGSLDTSLIYAKQALRLAKSIALDKSRNINLDIKKASIKGMAIAYLNIGYVYEDLGNYPKALKNFFASLKINEVIKNKKGISNAYNAIGIVYWNEADYSKAIDYFFKSLKIAEELEDKTGIARTLNNIGMVYDDQANYPKALEYYFKSLKIAEELEDKTGIARKLNNIGMVYNDQANYPKALEYYFKSLKMAEELGNKEEIAEMLNNIGIVYYNQANYPKALEYFFKSLKMKEELGNKEAIANTLNNIGIVYGKQSDYSKAIEYFLKSLKMKEELGDKNSIAIRLGNIGLLYTKIGKFNEAEKYLKQSLALCDSIGALDGTRDIELSLSQLYDTTGKYKLALEHYKKYIVARDSITNDEKKKQQLYAEMNYEFEKKQAIAKAEQEKKDAIVAIERKKERVVRYAVTGGLLLVLIFLGFVYRSLRITRKQKKLIEEQKKLVDEKNIMLHQQNEEISRQRDEISTQRDEIAAQRDLVIKQKEHIEEQKKQITDSINYAKRIQEAVLPMSETARSVLGEHFILFRPKDIVSGDFYWTTQIDEWLIVAVADCTGHGVPGAFMSMLGISFLNEIVRKKEITKTNEVLNQLRKEIIHALQQKGIEGEQKDGMDIALVAINKNTSQCQFSGANNPLYVVKKFENEPSPSHQIISSSTHQLFEYKGDKMPIAIYERMDDFTYNEFQLEDGDMLYLFSDGYADQFGGEQGKKFMYKRFKELIVNNANKSMNEQKQALEETIVQWIDKGEQTDDITVVGIKI
jgi:tetratricopeptide (TPR) repeat protein